MSELNIACVCVGEKYPDVWVARLARMVADNCAVPYTFHVITEPGRTFAEADVVHEADTERLPGWWSKLELFRPGRFVGPVLYFDLDLTIVADIAPLIREHLTGASETRDPRKHRLNSSVMAWVPSAKTEAIFTLDPPIGQQKKVANWTLDKGCWGDQVFIRHAYPDYRLFAVPEVALYKKHLKPGEPLPEEARVVAFNGSPKPHQAKALAEEWNAMTWRGLELPDSRFNYTGPDYTGAVVRDPEAKGDRL